MAKSTEKFRNFAAGTRVHVTAKRIVREEICAALSGIWFTYPCYTMRGLGTSKSCVQCCFLIASFMALSSVFVLSSFQ